MVELCSGNTFFCLVLDYATQLFSCKLSCHPQNGCHSTLVTPCLVLSICLFLSCESFAYGGCVVRLITAFLSNKGNIRSTTCVLNIQ